MAASYPQYSLSDDIQVDHQVRNILQHGLYKDTTIEKAIINDTFEGYDKKTITNIHWIHYYGGYSRGNYSNSISSDKPWCQTESLVRIIVNKNRRA